MRHRKPLEQIQADLAEKPWSRNDIDPELAITHRILQRWAVSVGTGVPGEDWQEQRKSKPPPLDDPTAIKVDQEIQKAPHRTKEIIRLWYKTELPWEYIARAVGVRSRASLYTHRNAALWYFKGRFDALNIRC